MNKKGWGIALMGTGCALLLSAVVRVPEPPPGRVVGPADAGGGVVTEFERIRLPAEDRVEPAAQRD